MKYRQKALLYLTDSLQREGKSPTKTFLVKLLFVAAKETPLNEKPFYSFYPHLYGPFSDAYYSDFTELCKHGYLDGFQLTEKGIGAAQGVRKKDKQTLDQLSGRFDGEKGIVKYVYERYPDYAARSRLPHATLPKAEPGIFSIGYQGKDSDAFLDVLIRNQIEEVVDVRANPFSMNFTFIKSRLEAKLEKIGIAYRHIPELGIDGSLRREYLADNDYRALFETYSATILPQAQKQVEKLMELGANRRIALLCFEQDVNCCHRGILSKKIEKITGKKVGHL